MPSVATTASGDRGSFAPCGPKKIEEFHGITALRSGRTVVRRTWPDDIPPLLQAAQAAMRTALASETVVKRVAAQHPDAFWTFLRNDRLVGFLAMLMLNRAGLEALLSGHIDLQDPAPRFLSGSNDRPVAIYIWGVFASALAVDGVAEVMLRLRSPQYDSTDIYASQATKRGARFLQRLNFQPVPGSLRNLYRYIRLANRPH